MPLGSRALKEDHRVIFNLFDRNEGMMLNDVLQTDRKLKVYIFDIIECVLG